MSAMEQQPYQETHQEGVLGYCRSCGRSVPRGEGRQWQGSLHCMDCVVKLSHESPERTAILDEQPAGPRAAPASYDSATSAPPFAPSAGRSPSPILALILGLIPGVGAVYNGQYAKGILHVVVFGGIISAIGSGAAAGAEPLFAMLLGLMGFYMPIEAFRTARAMERGEPVDEFSGLLPPGHSTGRSPAAGIVLIALGVVFLLQSLGFLHLRDLVRFWPLSLIAMGIYLLYRRVAEGNENGGPSGSGRGFSDAGSWREGSLRPPSASQESGARASEFPRSEEAADVSGRASGSGT